MPSSSSKANYKSYEAQARLVRAIVAAHPTVKWNYKEIAACYGSDMSEHALNHRFRHIRAQTEIIHEGRKAGLDMKSLVADESALPKTVGGVDKNNIAKYFGQSTADGIQFQFRTIKSDASRMKEEADKGGDPSSCIQLGGGSSSSATLSTPRTSRSHNVQTPTSTGKSTATKRRVNSSTIIKKESDTNEESEQSQDWSELEESPTKRLKDTANAATPGGRRNGTPSRHAAARARATIAHATAALTSASESENDPPKPFVWPMSAAGATTDGTAAFSTSAAGGSGGSPAANLPTRLPPSSSAVSNGSHNTFENWQASVGDSGRFANSSNFLDHNDGEF